MKRGYAVSGMLYTILVLFMALLLSFLYTMQNKKNILDKLKTEVVEAFYCSKADNIEDLRGSTVVATAVTQEGDNALIQLPKEGRYDTTSYLSVPMSEISKDSIKYDTFLFPSFNASIEINVGFEPSIVIIMVHKGNNTAYLIYDTQQDVYLRGFTIYSDTWGYAENALSGDIELTSTGFKVTNKLSSTTDISNATARYYVIS